MSETSPFKHRTFEPNCVIFSEGDPAEAVYVIKSGSVVIRIGTRGDNPQTVTTLGEGDIFGELALLENRSHSATAVAVEKTETVEVPHEEFLKRLNASDPIMKVVVNRLVLRLRELTSELEKRGDFIW